MLGLGTIEIVVIGCVAVMLFGSRLPKVARSVGQSVVEFRRGFLEIDKECRKIEQEAHA
jgi:sec-independent protein translocase protein TatA